MSELPQVKKVERVCLESDSEIWEQYVEKLKTAKRILITPGQNSSVSEKLKKSIRSFFEKYNSAIAIDYMSNIDEDYAINIFMKRICKTCMNGERIYSPKVLLGITLLFIVSGSMFLFTYSFRILRYLLVGLWIVLAFIKRSVILEKIKAILGVKRGSDK